MKKILFVDDEPNVLAGFQRQLHNLFSIETALGPEAGLTALKEWRNYSVVVADMRMPGMNGVEFLSRIKVSAPDVVRIMLTGNADQATSIEAINQGNIFRFLNKPCSTEKLTEALESAIRQHQLITAERDLLENTLCASIKVLTDYRRQVIRPSRAIARQRAPSGNINGNDRDVVAGNSGYARKHWSGDNSSRSGNEGSLGLSAFHRGTENFSAHPRGWSWAVEPDPTDGRNFINHSLSEETVQW